MLQLAIGHCKQLTLRVTEGALQDVSIKQAKVVIGVWNLAIAFLLLVLYSTDKLETRLWTVFANLSSMYLSIRCWNKGVIIVCNTWFYREDNSTTFEVVFWSSILFLFTVINGSAIAILTGWF